MYPRSAHPRRRLPLVALLLVALVGAACSSTAQKAKDAQRKLEAGATTVPGAEGAVPVEGEGAVGTSVAGKKGSTAKGVTGGKTGGSGGTSTGGGSGGTGGGSGGGGSGGTGGGGGGAIEVGIPWQDTAAANAALFAVTGATGFVGSQKIQAQAVIDYLNAHGGFGGRRIEPVYFQIDVAQYVTKEGRQREAQRMCAAFTEDRHVFAMISGAPSMPEANVVDCAVQKKTPMVMSKPDGITYLTQSRMAQIADYYYWPDGFTSERRERTVVAGLAGQGFLPANARVALMVEDDPAIKEGVEKGLLPALAARGITPVARADYPDIIDSPWDTYVLQFQTATATHVLFSASTGSTLPSTLFMRAAENQQFRPKYGMGSDHRPAGAVALAPAEQLKGLHVVGWSPWLDTLTTDPASSNDSLCRSIMKGVGQPEQSNNNGFCQGLFLLKAGLDQSKTFTVAGLAAGVNALGTSYPSVFSLGTRFAPGRHDGTDVVRDAVYRTDCNCIKYTSGSRPAL